MSKRQKDVKQGTLPGIVPDKPRNSEGLEDKIKALAGLIAYPLSSPVASIHDFRAIENLLKQAKRGELGRYWIQLTATLYASYREQGYLQE